MNSVGAVDHLLVIFRTTAGRTLLFALNRTTFGVLLPAYLKLFGPQIFADVLDPRFIVWFRPVSERRVVSSKGLGAGGPTIFSFVAAFWGN